MESTEYGTTPPPPVAAEQENAINLRHYWHVILERRWLIIAAFISVFVLSLIYLFNATPIYRATARLQINPDSDNILRMEGGLAVGRQDQEYLQTQYKNLLSRTLLDSVVNTLKEEARQKGEDASNISVGDIQVSPIRLSRLVDISVEHSDKILAARVANVLVSNFITLNMDQKIYSSLMVGTGLTSLATTQLRELTNAEAKLQAFIETNQSVSFEESENIKSQALKQQYSELARIEIESIVARTVSDETSNYLAQVQQGQQGAISKFSIPAVFNSAEIRQLQSAMDTAQIEFAVINSKYKEGMPQFQEAKLRMEYLQNTYSNRADDILREIRLNAAETEAKKKNLEALVKDREETLIKFKNTRLSYAVLKRNTEANDQLYRQVLSKKMEAELTGRDKIQNLVMRDPALVPSSPVKPRKVMTIFLGLVGGLVVALGLAFFVNYLDDSIKSQDDVETYLRLPFLGYVPNIKTNSVVERDLQSHSHPQSNAAEGFRTIRATVSLTHKPDKFKIMAITSTIPSEGKSLVASNLAIVTAQTGLKTLLVDADLRRPSVHKAYQLHSPKGLSSYLMSELNDLDAIVHKTDVPNLEVICCGAVPSSPSELIGSKRMIDFLEAARGRYDRVILDSPPISAVSDPLIIAAMADGVVFVTKFNKIRREHARKAVQRVQNAGIHILGVVLNDIDFEGRDSYYYSYYYYQNRYYSSHYKTVGPEQTKSKPAVPAPKDRTEA